MIKVSVGGRMTRRQVWVALVVLVVVVVGMLVFAFDEESDETHPDLGEDRSTSIVPTPN